MTSWRSSIKIYKLPLLKNCHGVKQNGETENVMKLEVFILVRIDQKREKGWWRGRRERIEKGNRKRIEIERKGK